jgi:TetR/AcrR family transcriptional regulator, ethionamide resistance regulator
MTINTVSILSTPGTMPAMTTARLARGRRQSRPSGDDRQLAILTTAERLLAERDFADISIDDLARGAGISRPTFYFYFPSKVAVLLTLLDRVVQEAERATGDVLRRLAEDPRARWRQAIARFYETFDRHRAVALACARVQHANPEVRALWSAVMEGWVTRTQSAIQAERRRGAAPPGLPARDLAIALNAMNERVFYGMFSGIEPVIARGKVVDVLLEVWLRTVYGSSP